MSKEEDIFRFFGISARKSRVHISIIDQGCRLKQMELIRNRLKNRKYTKKRYLNTGLIPTPEKSPTSLTDETFLIKQNSVIRENMDNSSLDIQFICQEVELGRSSLYNKLKVFTGMGANDYINKLRIEKAITFISNTDMIFSEIAEKMGFATPSYFSTAFKQYTRETPSQYKENIRKEILNNKLPTI